jgi:LacI family transcriptional regulator
LTVPLFPPLLLGVDDVLSAAGYTALVVNTDNSPARERARLAALQARRVDGLLVATATIGEGSDPAMYTDLAPTVFVVRTPADPGAASVISDDYAGVHSVIDHLASLGHRRIAHIGGPPNISTAITRLRAYREALFERQLPLEPQLVTHVQNIAADDGTAAMERLLADGGANFTAVLAFNDLVAFGAYRALRAQGLRCAEDISIVGYTDMTGADLVDPPLTTVAVDHHAMGQEAARMLLGMLQDRGARTPHSVRLPVELKVRESTSAPRGAPGLQPRRPS